MAIVRMPLCGLSLCVVMLLWAQPSLAGPEKALSLFDAKMCQDAMKKIYNGVELRDLGDNTDNEIRKASVNRTAQEYINKSLPPFKEKCGPLEANSVRDLENGNYLRTLAAAREKRKKAHSHIKDSGPEIPDSELFEGLEIQR